MATNLGELERMMYGDVENDAELLDELMALAGDDSDTEAAAPVRTNNKLQTKQSAAASSSAAPRQSQPAVNKRPAQKSRPAAESNVADFDEIHKLARQISMETNVKDDVNDDSVEMDEDLLDELDMLMSEDEDEVEESVTERKGEVEASAPSVPPPPAARPVPPPPVPARTPASITQPLPQPIIQPEPAISQPPTTATNIAPPAPSQPQPVVQPEATPLPTKAAPPATPSPTKAAPPPVPTTTLDGLQQRLAFYKENSAKAKLANDDRKSRQNDRLADQYKMAIKKVQAGKMVNLEELPSTPNFPPIPPQGAGPAARAQPAQPRPASLLTEPQAQNAQSPITNQREALIKQALAAKAAGDLDTAKQLLLQAKQLPSPMVTPATGGGANAGSIQSQSGGSRRVSTESKMSIKSSVSSPAQTNDLMGALQQRMNIFKQTALGAAQKGDERRSRQCERIVQQYSDCIRAHKAGRSIDLAALPCPAGLKPLDEMFPTQTPAPVAAPPQAKPPASPSVPSHSSSSLPASRQQQQLQFIRHRQQQFKEAALFAKKHNDLALAKKYLLQARGFDEMIEASESGLPVNIANIPEPPQLRTSAQSLRPQLSVDESSAPSLHVPMDNRELYATLEGDMIKQIQICERNVAYYTRLGDVQQVTVFEQSALDTKRDLIALRQASKHGDPTPKFHYEQRVLPVLQCSADLGECDLEVGIVRAIDVKLPSGYKAEHADLSVKYKLEYPADAHQSGHTSHVLATTSPEFNSRVMMRVDTKSRAFQRTAKRHGVKFEVLQRVGFMRSDKSCGTCECKLSVLETKADARVSLELLDGRRPCGGRLEVRLRMRQPLTDTAPGTSTEKWLVIDKFIAQPQPKPAHRQSGMAVGNARGAVQLPTIPTQIHRQVDRDRGALEEGVGTSGSGGFGLRRMC